MEENSENYQSSEDSKVYEGESNDNIDEDGDDDAMLFVLLRDIDDVLYRAKGGAFVYPCTVDDEESAHRDIEDAGG